MRHEPREHVTKEEMEELLATFPADILSLFEGKEEPPDDLAEILASYANIQPRINIVYSLAMTAVDALIHNKKELCHSLLQLRTCLESGDLHPWEDISFVATPQGEE